MQERELINRMLEEGKISREEADELLAALKKSYGYDSGGGLSPEEKTEDKGKSREERKRVPLEEEEGPAVKGQAAGREGSTTSQQAETDPGILENLSNLFNTLLGPKQSLYEEYQGVFEAAEPLIEIDNTNGQIEVYGWQEDFFKLKLEFRVNARNEEEAEKARQSALKYNCSSDELSLKVASKSFFKISANIKLYLPTDRNYHLALSSTNGKIDLKGIGYKKGEIKLTNGKLRINNVNGEELGLKVSNGLIDFTGSAGVLDARINNGNINITPAVEGPTSLELRTTNGNLKIMLPGEKACYFEARTKNGLVSADYQGMDTVRSESMIMKRHLVARTAGWEDSPDRIEIQARTTNGNIKVERVS